MKRRASCFRELIFLALSALVLFGCAHFPEGERVKASLPAEFGLTQVVHVRSGEMALDFIASVSRRGDDCRIAMLDPVVLRPLYIARMQGGELTEELPLPEEARAMGPMLIGALSELFGADAFALQKPSEGSGEASFVFWTRRFEFRLTPWDAASPCGFPQKIQMTTRGGPNLSVTAETEDISCDGEADAESAGD